MTADYSGTPSAANCMLARLVFVASLQDADAISAPFLLPKFCPYGTSPFLQDRRISEGNIFPRLPVRQAGMKLIFTQITQMEKPLAR
jgi:hypothetical protein